MLRVFIYYKKDQTRIDHDGGPLEFGRGPRREAYRLVLNDPTVSSDQLRIEELPGGRLRLRNLSRKFPARLANGVDIPPSGDSEVGLPVQLLIGETTLHIETAEDDLDQDILRTVGRPLRPGELEAFSRLPGEGESVSAETLVRWFEGVVAVQRASASSGEFYRQTAHAVVDLIGLDRGLVLLRKGDDWEVVARDSDDRAGEVEFSRSILDRVCQERQTLYQDFAESVSMASLMGVKAVVAAPILSDDDRVLGVVYGSRSQQSALIATIRPLEAQLVQVLAAAVGAGLARLESEANAARRQVQFEQFFSTELARELDRDPSLLDGREREITILFSDIRGFSRLSEKLSPSDVCRLARDVMDRLTVRVRQFGGVVVNYNGDGIMAMWNAPALQPDHAVLACQAALAMHAELPAIDAIWQSRIGRPMALGIGLNTGSALVGNTGSRTKFMYGPQGHAVNLASRVEGATKQLGVPILITGSTHARLAGAFATRRLCRVRVVGIDGAVDLHELCAARPDEEWCGRRDLFESGLAFFETGMWSEACDVLLPLMAGQEGRYDLPTLSLVGRCIECLRSPQRAFDPVIELDQK